MEQGRGGVGNRRARPSYPAIRPIMIQPPMGIENMTSRIRRSFENSGIFGPSSCPPRECCNNNEPKATAQICYSPSPTMCLPYPPMCPIPGPMCPMPCYTPPPMYCCPCPPPPQPQPLPPSCCPPPRCHPYPCLPPPDCCPPPPCPPPPCCPRRPGGCSSCCCGGGKTIVRVPKGCGPYRRFPSSRCPPPPCAPPPAYSPDQPASYNNCNFYVSELPKGFSKKLVDPSCPSIPRSCEDEEDKCPCPNDPEPECDPCCCAPASVKNYPAGDCKVFPPPLGYPCSRRHPWGNDEEPVGDNPNNIIIYDEPSDPKAKARQGAINYAQYSDAATATQKPSTRATATESIGTRGQATNTGGLYSSTSSYGGGTTTRGGKNTPYSRAGTQTDRDHRTNVGTAMSSVWPKSRAGDSSRGTTRGRSPTTGRPGTTSGRQTTSTARSPGRGGGPGAGAGNKRGGETHKYPNSGTTGYSGTGDRSGTGYTGYSGGPSGSGYTGNSGGYTGSGGYPGTSSNSPAPRPINEDVEASTERRFSGSSSAFVDPNRPQPHLNWTSGERFEPAHPGVEDAVEHHRKSLLSHVAHIDHLGGAILPSDSRHNGSHTNYLEPGPSRMAQHQHEPPHPAVSHTEHLPGPLASHHFHVEDDKDRGGHRSHAGGPPAGGSYEAWPAQHRIGPSGSHVDQREPFAEEEEEEDNNVYAGATAAFVDPRHCRPKGKPNVRRGPMCSTRRTCGPNDYVNPFVSSKYHEECLKHNHKNYAMPQFVRNQLERGLGGPRLQHNEFCIPEANPLPRNPIVSYPIPNYNPKPKGKSPHKRGKGVKRRLHE